MMCVVRKDTRIVETLLNYLGLNVETIKEGQRSHTSHYVQGVTAFLDADKTNVWGFFSLVCLVQYDLQFSYF